MSTTLTIIPSARRLMTSLRDIGYDLPAAVADIIDNSIEAKAANVAVTVAFEGVESWIRIADDGTGMTAQTLNEAMRYGTDRDYADTDLGKFGLGLKTASLSQCRSLTVATRTNPVRREIEIRRWDLDHVADQDRWELLRLTTAEVRPEVVEPLQDHTGTVVMWEALDRVLDYKHPDGLAAQHGLEGLCREIEEHLAMVFHRLLSGEARPKLALTLNQNPVDAWDPFARTEEATQRLERQILTLRYEGRTHSVRVQPYILPSQSVFSTSSAFDHFSGPKKWNRQQGFYIYRSNRMIQSGGWNRLRTADEHTKLARIAVDLPRAADTAFAINVSKMRVLIPAEIRPGLKAIATGVANKAKSAYSKGAAPTSRPVRPTTPAPPSGGDAPLPKSDWMVEAADSVEYMFDGAPSGGVATAARQEGRQDGGVISLRVVREVLTRYLRDDPELVDRILMALRNASAV